MEPELSKLILHHGQKFDQKLKLVKIFLGTKILIITYILLHGNQHS